MLVPQELPAALQVGDGVVVLGQARRFETATHRVDNLAVGGIAFLERLKLSVCDGSLGLSACLAMHSSLVWTVAGLEPSSGARCTLE